jgi:hypothetical protein
MDLITACQDSHLFKPWFRDPATWSTWFTFIRALFALPMDEQELEIYTRCTGRVAPLTEPASESWLACGRRSGKSFILSLIAVYLSTFRDWRPYLAPGEHATVMVVASDRKQARTILRYIKAFLEECALLKPLIQRMAGTNENYSIELDGRVTIEVHSCSFRRVRGYTVVAALLDEIAFWRSDEGVANPDREVIAAIRPAMATVPGSMMLCASSPYSRRGALWDAHRRYFAKDGPILIWQASTLTMNPTIPARVVEAEFERDPTVAASEWAAEFRTDVESYVTREAIESCIEPGVRERPPIQGVRYRGFVDPSGGRNDSMTLAIAHREEDCAVLDCVREVKPPFDPSSVVREFADTLKYYNVREVRGDKYGGEWPAAEFRRANIWYRSAERPKSDLYRELLPAVNARRVELLDNSRLVAQLVGLERRVGRGGRDSVDHGPGAHDDVANACAGAIDMVLGKARSATVSSSPLLGI